MVEKVELIDKNTEKNVGELGVIANIFEVNTITSNGLTYEIAAQRRSFLLLTHTWCNTHFPGLVPAVHAGFSVGLTSAEILGNYYSGLWASKKNVDTLTIDLNQSVEPC